MKTYADMDFQISGLFTEDLWSFIIQQFTLEVLTYLLFTSTIFS